MESATLHPGSIGAELHRRRLEHRAQRLRRVLAALEDRALTRAGAGGAAVPAGLREAIRGFRAELRGVERELGR